jgi:hypothetical protein
MAAKYIAYYLMGVFQRTILLYEPVEPSLLFGVMATEIPKV